MATLNFPTNPTLNQTYSFGGKTWVWNGQGWQLSASGAINNIPIGNITPASGAFTTLSANTFAANSITVLGNITGANLNANGNLSVAGNVNSPLNVRANVTATNFVTAGTLTAGIVSATGNVTGAYIIGDGSQLTNLPGVNYSNANVANYLPTYSGNLVSLTGPVTTTGNLTGSNIITSGLLTAAGNITGGNLRTAGSITATGNITGGNLATGNIVSASINSSGLISVVGNITGAYIFGNGSQLTGLPATYSNANVAAYLPTYTGNLPNLTGPVTTTGNLTGGNVLTSGVISAAGIITGGNVSTGNITAGNVSTVGNVRAAYFLGDGSQLTNLPAGNYSNANVANYLPTYTGNLASLTGPVTTTSNITGGNLRTAGSITATGNITSGNVATGNITGGNASIAGTISATGNIAGAYILGDGSQLTNLPAGNYSNANVANYLPTYTGNLASLTGPVTTTANVTGGNVLTAGLISAIGNITGGNVATGNILAGNVSTVGNVSGTYILGDGSQLTNLPAGNYSNANVAAYLPTYTGNLISLTGPVTTTANITGGNLATAGAITATGNIAGGNIATGNLLAANVESLGTVSAVGNITGTYFIGNGALLTGIASGNNNYSNANVAAYLPTYTGNLVSLTGPVITTGNITGGNVSTVGNVTANNLIANSRLKIGLANIYTTNFDPAVLQIQSEVVGFSGQIIATSDISGNNLSAGGNVVGSNIRTSGMVSATGNMYAANFIGNVTGNITAPGATTQILFNDGGLASANAGLTFNKTTQVLSVTGNIQSGNLRTAGLISATGNIAGQYFVGNGALLTGIIATAGAAITNGNSNVTVSGNGNVTVTVAGVANVTTFTSTGVYVAGLVSAIGNVAGNYLIGNGALITGLPVGYSNADVAAYLPTYSGNLPSLTGLVSTTGNISGNYILGNGSLLTGIDATSIQNGTSNVRVVSSGGNVTIGVGGTGNVAVFATTGAYITGELSATGNITGNYFIGNGSQLTGVAASSVNANALIGNTLSANVLYSSLTTVGNLANLSVVGNTISGNLLTSGLISATGNVDTGNINTVGLASVTGNITGGNLSTSGLITASGNISGNNIFATTLISVIGNLIAANVNTNAIRPVSGELTITTPAGNLNLQPAGNIVLANTYINSVAYPAQDTDAATKLYVDNMVSTALTFHQAVYAATTTTLATTTSGTITYTQPNGVANGVGATLATTGTFDLIDTANVQTIGTRILVKNEANAVYNGVYTWANATNIVRSSDTDEYGPNSVEEISINDYFFVQTGTVNGGSAYVVDAPAGTITFGSSNIAFAQFSQASIYTANTSAGLSLIGSQFNAKVDNDTTAFDVSGNIIVKASANLTTPNIGAATGTSLSLTGNAISGNVLTGGLISATATITGGNLATGGTASATGNITGANLITGGLVTAVGNVIGGNLIAGALTKTVDFSISGNVIGNLLPSANATFNLGGPGQLWKDLYLAGNTLYLADQSVTANATAIATANNFAANNLNAVSGITAGTTVSAVGNVIGGNITSAGLASITGNVIGGNITTVGEVSATANVIGGNLTTGGLISATSTITSAANITGGNVLTSGLISATANITGGNLVTTGLATVTGNITGGNVLTSGLISSTGNITGGNLNAAGLSLSGNVLSVINSTSNITTTANAAVGNLLTDGLYHANGVAWDFQQPAGSNTQIQYNDGSGGFGASANFTFNDSTQLLSVAGAQSVTGNITSGNLNAAGLSLSSNVVSALNSTSNITTTANIAGNFFIGNGSQLTGVTASSVDANNLTGNTLNSGVIFSSLTTVGTLTSLSVSGNVTGGNVLTGGLISSTGNITGGNISTSGSGGNISGANVISGTTLSATANVIGGNITTAGLISATSTITSAANIAGGNITTGGEVSATGNITGGNLNTTGQLSTSGNLAANNVSVTNSLTSSVISASANITGGNLLTSGLISSAGTITGTTITGSTLSSTGNVNTVGIVGTGNISTTGNISSGNILTGGLSLSANVISEINTTSNITTTANISSGNVLTVRVSASGNIDGANINVGTAVYTSNIIGKTNALTLESVSNGNINLFPNGTGNIVLANTTINGLAEPLQSQDAATKFYVDNAVTTGFAFHQPVFAATNTDLATATGGTITYAQPNGAANGIGATITTTGSFNLIDTANVQTANTRILVKNETNAVLNGVYVWSNATVITRSVDADQYGSDSAESFSINDYFFTQSGNVNAGTAFIVNAPAGVITFGTSNITFAEFSSTQVYSANTSAGLSLVGTVFSAKVDNTTTAFDGGGNIVVKASAQLTTPNIGAATGDSLSVTGLITGGNITAGTGYISTTGNVDGGNINTGGLITATGNIVSSANVAGGNILTGGLISATATITGGNLATGGTASATGNITGGNVLTGGLISATGNITGGNILTAGIVSTSGNVYGNAILSNNYYYANGTPVPPGIIYTANTAPPTTPAPKVTDQWYDTSSDVLYEYITDGTSTYWVDTTSPAFAGGVVANVAISGTLVPVANVTYDIGTNTVYFRNTYTQNLYTNNRLTASNMPSGAVIQTVMSTSLGGSATTGTSYSDIALANVVIQPSSANSKVLIIATGTSSFTPLAAANLTASTQLVRTAASLQIQDYSANIAGGGVGGSSAVAFSYLDSPGTTSPVTYKMQQKISNSSSTLTSSNMWIIAMEIAVP